MTTCTFLRHASQSHSPSVQLAWRSENFAIFFVHLPALSRLHIPHSRALLYAGLPDSGSLRSVSRVR